MARRSESWARSGVPIEDHPDGHEVPGSAMASWQRCGAGYAGACIAHLGFAGVREPASYVVAHFR